MSPLPRLQSAAASVALGVLVAACGSGHAPPAPAATDTTQTRSSHATVIISGYAYTPARISITPDTTIRFTNHDQTPHTATSSRSGFDTGSIKPGRSATVVVTKPGVYTYYCQFHAFMHATITVQ